MKTAAVTITLTLPRGKTQGEGVAMDANTEERNWGAEEGRAPMMEDGDTLLYSECGRVIKAGSPGHKNAGIDYRSHYFRVAANHGCYLIVRHGGGQERFQLDYSASRAKLFFDPLDSDTRYLLMHQFYSIHSKARRSAIDETAAQYKRAFVDGTLRKRRLRGQSECKVWIESNQISLGY